MPSFEAPRYFWFHRNALLSALHDTLIFPRTPFDLKMVTPRCLAPPFPARSFKIMRRWRRQDQRDVKIIARSTTILCSNWNTVFVSSQLCFLLFHVLDFTQLLCFTEMLFSF
jgi:hypothetical protein